MQSMRISSKKDKFLVLKHHERLINVFLENFNKDNPNAKLKNIKKTLVLCNKNKSLDSPQHWLRSLHLCSLVIKRWQKEKNDNAGRRSALRLIWDRNIYPEHTWWTGLTFKERTVWSRYKSTVFLFVFCIHNYCNNIMKRPVLTSPCKHSSCLRCLIKNVEGETL